MFFFKITEIFCAAASGITSIDLKELLVDTGVLSTILVSLSRQSIGAAYVISQFQDSHQVLLNWTRVIAHATEHSQICRLIGDQDCSQLCVNFINLIALHWDQFVRRVNKHYNLLILCLSKALACFLYRI